MAVQKKVCWSSVPSGGRPVTHGRLTADDAVAALDQAMRQTVHAVPKRSKGEKYSLTAPQSTRNASESDHGE